MVTTIVRLCDICGEPAESVEVTVTGLLPTSDADLCERHRKELLDPLVAFMVEHGARSSTARTGTGGNPRKGVQPAGERDVPCLLCDAMFATNTGVRRHWAVVHGIEDTTYTAVFGGGCPICGEDIAARGIGTHLGKSHPGVPNLVAAYAWARDHGDEFGYSAALLKRAKRSKWLL